MRNLNINEINHVSGAASCVMTDTLSIQSWKMLEEGAHKEALMAGLFMGALTGAIVASIAPLMAAGAAGVIVGEITYHVEYRNYELWPWNY